MEDPHRFVHQRWIGGYFAVSYRNGTLVLRRNGFLREPAMLDQLAMDTCAIAQQFADAVLPADRAEALRDRAARRARSPT